MFLALKPLKLGSCICFGKTANLVRKRERERERERESERDGYIVPQLGLDVGNNFNIHYLGVPRQFHS